MSINPKPGQPADTDRQRPRTTFGEPQHAPPFKPTIVPQDDDQRPAGDDWDRWRANVNTELAALRAQLDHLRGESVTRG